MHYRLLPSSIREQVESEGIVPNPATGNPMHFWDNLDDAQRYHGIVNELDPHDMWQVMGDTGKLVPDPWFTQTVHDWESPGAWRSDSQHVRPEYVKRVSQMGSEDCTSPPAEHSLRGARETSDSNSGAVSGNIPANGHTYTKSVDTTRTPGQELRDRVRARAYSEHRAAHRARLTVSRPSFKEFLTSTSIRESSERAVEPAQTFSTIPWEGFDHEALAQNFSQIDKHSGTVCGCEGSCKVDGGAGYNHHTPWPEWFHTSRSPNGTDGWDSLSLPQTYNANACPKCGGAWQDADDDVACSKCGYSVPYDGWEQFEGWEPDQAWHRMFGPEHNVGLVDNAWGQPKFGSALNPSKFFTTAEQHEARKHAYAEKWQRFTAADPEWLKHYMETMGPYLYHGTTDDVARQIEDEGLFPHDQLGTGEAKWVCPNCNYQQDHDPNESEPNRGPAPCPECGDDYLKESPGYSNSSYAKTYFEPRNGHVYLGTHDYIQEHIMKPNGAMMRVDLRQLDPSLMSADEDHWYPHNPTTDVSNPAIRGAYDRAPIPNPHQNVNTLGRWADQVGLGTPEETHHSMGMGSMAYNGHIPAHAIDRVSPYTAKPYSYDENGQPFVQVSKTASGVATDMFTCNSCGSHAMTEPIQMANKWMQTCTNCGRTRQVDPTHPLIRSLEQMSPQYPQLLGEVGPERPMNFFGKETPNQIARRWESLNAQHPNTARVVHQFPNGWTVQQLTTRNDVNRVGKMMNNCWRGKAVLYPKRQDLGSRWHTMNDENGHPQVAFYLNPYGMEQSHSAYSYLEPGVVQFPRMEIDSPLGVRNKRLQPGHADLFREWASAQGTPLAMRWSGQPAEFDHPIIQNAYFSGKGSVFDPPEEDELPDYSPYGETYESSAV